MVIAEMRSPVNGDLGRVSCEVQTFMEIRFISSLTAEDENSFAPALLKAVGALLDEFPIAYTIRIETTGAQVYQHTHAAPHELARAEPGESSANGARAAYYLTRISSSKSS